MRPTCVCTNRSATNIRFKRKSVNGPFSNAAADDGKNTIQISNLGSPNAQAALLQGLAYFSIDCGGSDGMDEDGGFIMTDLDFLVQPEFAMGNDQSRAIRVFTHELGHAHMLNHARCFGALCGGPLMHPQATTGIQAVDIDGGNEIFGDSEDILLNGCQQGGSTITPVKIQTGSCGTIVATEEYLLVGVELFPNPTHAAVSISGLNASTRYALWNMAGQQIAAGEMTMAPYELDMSAYPPGSYFLRLINKEGIGHYKIIKL